MVECHCSGPGNLNIVPWALRHHGKFTSRVMGCAYLLFIESSWHMGRHDDTQVLWTWAEHLEPDEINRNKQNHLMRL